MKRLVCWLVGHDWHRLQRVLVRVPDPIQEVWEHQLLCNRCRILCYGSNYTKRKCPGNCWLGCP